MTIQYRGTNLCGGDTAWQEWAGATPVDGEHYMFVTTKDVDYLLAQGANCFRLLFGWEAMQPAPRGSIPSTITNHATYYTRFRALVDYITSKGASVVIDIHDGTPADFAAYYGVTVGGTYQGTPVAVLLADLWGKLAAIFKGNARVIFGITNEPHDMTAAFWYTAAQGIVDAIRAVGATNLILMPGVDWTGASTWLTSNAPYWNLVDSAKNLGVQVHLYADADAGGGATDVASATVLADRMKQVTTWARGKGLKVLVAEVGLAASNGLAAQAWGNFAAFCTTNADTILGFTWWAYGPPSWWGGYQFSLCPTANYTAPSPQMKLVASAMAAPVVAPAPAPPTPVDPTVALNAQIAKLTSDLASETTYANGLISRIAMAKAALE